jgi:hypothetical protein
MMLSPLGLLLFIIVLILLIKYRVAVMISIKKVKNNGTPKGRMITGLTLIGFGTAILFAVMRWHGITNLMWECFLLLHTQSSVIWF